MNNIELAKLIASKAIKVVDDYDPPSNGSGNESVDEAFWYPKRTLFFDNEMYIAFDAEYLSDEEYIEMLLDENNQYILKLKNEIITQPKSTK